MKREQKVLLQRFADGVSNKEIAEEFNVHIATIKHESSYLLRKFKAKNRAHLMVIAIRKGLLALLFLLLTTVGKGQPDIGFHAGGNILSEHIGHSWCYQYGCNLEAYRVTLKLIYIPPYPAPPAARIFVWDNDNGYLWAAKDQPLDSWVQLREKRDPCVLGDSLQYRCFYYKCTFDFAPNVNGYTVSYQQGL